MAAVAATEGLGGIGEPGQGERRGVPDDLVDEVGLGGVEGLRAVAQEAGREEGPPTERLEEASGRDESLHGLEAKAGGREGSGVQVLELRDRIAKERELVAPLHEAARPVLAMEREQRVPDRPPGALLLLRVRERRHWLPRDVRGGGRRDRVAARAVHGIDEAGMESGRDGLDLELSAHGIGRGVPGRRGSPAAPPRDRP